MKLHLPKMLLGAVLATFAVYTAEAGTGLYNNAQYLIGGTAGGNGVEQGTTINIVENTPDGGKLTTTIEKIDATAKSSFGIWADSNQNQWTNAIVNELAVADGAVITISKSNWGHNNNSNQPRYFDSLQIVNLNGSAEVHVTHADHKVAIDSVTGVLQGASNTGTLTIGKDSTSTTNLGGSITNSGTLNLNGAFAISSLDTLTTCVEGTLSNETHGYRIGTEYAIIANGGTINTGDGFAVKLNGADITTSLVTETGAIKYSTGKSATSTIYEITSACTTAVEYNGSTGDTAAATGFDMADGTTLILNSSLAATVTDGISLSGTSGATITLNGAGVTLNHTAAVKTENGAKVSYNVNGGTLKIHKEGTVSNISSINVNGGKATLSEWSANLGSENSYVDVLLSNDGAFTFSAGGSGGGNLYVNINVDGSGKLAGANWGNRVNIKGFVTGDGTLSLGQEYGTNVWWLSGAIKDAENGKLAISTENANSRVAITGENTYSGGTTLNGGKLIVGNSSALGTGKVTMNGGTLQMANEMDGNNVIQAGSDLNITAMDYKSGTVNIGEKKLTVTGKLTAAANMTIEGSGDTELGSLDLTAGTTLSTSGSLTIGELILNLDNYTDYTRTYDLVSVTGEGKNVTLTNVFTGTVDGYTCKVDGSGTNMLTLTFTKEPAQSDSLTTTVLDASLDGTMLTLKVDGDITSAEMTANITGFADGMLDKILNLTKGVEDGLVGIKLVDDDQEYSILGNGVDNVGFYGAYYGAGNGQYFVQYIPEPATATLSLLALAGLAARRRRK